MRRTRSKFEAVDPIVHVNDITVVIEGVLKVMVVVVVNVIVVVVVVQSTLTHLLILI